MLKGLGHARAASATATIRTLEQDVEDQERSRAGRSLDDLDLRYRNRVAIPMARVVMFCLMDVSGSMDEGKKDLAKAFFTLLYLFLSRKYEHADLVFIRHTDNAEKWTSNVLLDPKSGGQLSCCPRWLLMCAILKSAIRPRPGTYAA